MCEECAGRVATVAEPADCFGQLRDPSMIWFARQAATADQEHGWRIGKRTARQLSRDGSHQRIDHIGGTRDGQCAAALEIEKHISATASADSDQARTRIRPVDGAELGCAIERPGPASVR